MNSSVKSLFRKTHDLNFKRYLSEVFDIKDTPMIDYQNKLVSSPPNTGKTTAVVNQLLSEREYVLIVADTLALAKQLASTYNLPLHYSGNKLSPDTKQLVTIYNWVSYFHPDGQAKHTVVLDECHSLITQQSFRPETLDLVSDSLVLFPEVYGLTGTYIESDFFNDYLIINGYAEELKDPEIHFVEFENPYSTIAELAYQFVKQDKQIFIYLPDKSSKLNLLRSALFDRGIYSISELNASTINSDDLLFENGSEIVEKQSFDSQVLITTYVQGYNLNNEDVVFIAFPGSDYVSVKQAIMRIRPGTYANFLLTNAKDEEHEFDSYYEERYEYWLTEAKKLYNRLLKDKSNSRYIRAVRNSSSVGDLVNESLDLNYLKISFRAYQDVCEKEDKLLLATSLQSVGLRPNKTYQFNSRKVNLNLTTKLVKVNFQDLVENVFSKEFNLLGYEEKQVYSIIQELRQFLTDEEIKDYLLTKYTKKTYKRYLAKLAMQASHKDSTEGRFRDYLKSKLTEDTYTSDDLRSLAIESSKVTGYQLDNDPFKDVKLVVDLERTTFTSNEKTMKVYKVVFN